MARGGEAHLGGGVGAIVGEWEAWLVAAPTTRRCDGGRGHRRGGGWRDDRGGANDVDRGGTDNVDGSSTDVIGGWRQQRDDMLVT